MRILIDGGHPAHVHNTKHLIFALREAGHEVLFSIREKEVATRLLSSYQIPFVVLGEHRRNLAGKLTGLLAFVSRLVRVARQFKPDLLVSNGSPVAALTSQVIGRPHIALDDTEPSYEQVLLYRPFTDVILSPDCFWRDLGRKQIRYSGYHELAYLHPNRFRPDASVVGLLGLKPGEPFAVLRFVSWDASHDVGRSGIDAEHRDLALREFSALGRVFVSSERPLAAPLNQYSLPTSPERIHDVLACATLLFGESATMASECAVLGTPAIYVDAVGRGYTNEEEHRFGLVFNFPCGKGDQLAAIRKGVEILKTPNVKEEWAGRQRRLLAEKIDVAAFFFWFVTNYPASVEVMRREPHYDLGFR